MDTHTLAAELQKLHPTTGVLYDSDNVIAADQLNAINCTRPRVSVSGQEIFEAAVPTEYNALSDSQRQTFLGIVGMSEIFISGSNTRAALLLMFDNQTTTRLNLVALQLEDISRATELRLGYVVARYVRRAREI